MKIYSYNEHSKSAKNLAKALGVLRIRHHGPLIRLDRVINWGASKIKRDIIANKILNKPINVGKASNKLECFKALDGHVDIPNYSTCPIEANKWLAAGVTVVERHKLTGHSGEGIVIVDADKHDKVSPYAKLYVKYIPKMEEYRVHVFRDKVFFVQRKARNKDVEDKDVNWKIRNHHNGFIYSHIDVDVPDVAKQAGIMAVKCLGLDFGAVDIVYNKRSNKYYVLEVNTACGMEGTTLQKYVEIFKNNW